MSIALPTQPADDLTVVAVEDHIEIHASPRGRGHVAALDPSEGYALAVWLEYLAGDPPGDTAQDLPAEAARDVATLYRTRQGPPPSLALPASVGVSTLCSVTGDYSIAIWLATTTGHEVFEYGVDLARMLAQRVLDCTLIVTLH